MVVSRRIRDALRCFMVLICAASGVGVAGYLRWVQGEGWRYALCAQLATILLMVVVFAWCCADIRRYRRHAGDRW